MTSGPTWLLTVLLEHDEYAVRREYLRDSNQMERKMFTLAERTLILMSTSDPTDWTVIPFASAHDKNQQNDQHPQAALPTLMSRESPG